MRTQPLRDARGANTGAITVCNGVMRAAPIREPYQYVLYPGRTVAVVRHLGGFRRDSLKLRAFIFSGAAGNMIRSMNVFPFTSVPPAARMWADGATSNIQ